MTDIPLKLPAGRKAPPPAEPKAASPAGRGLGSVPLSLLVVGATMLAAGALGFGWFFFARAPEPPPAVAQPPAYLTMRPPSVLVTTPARPILPDNGVARKTANAYEEALPHDIRQTYVPARPAPVAAMPAVAPPPAPLSMPDATAPPWRRFALAAPPAQGKPRVVVVIDDLGLDKKRSARAAALPGPLTLSYLTYANDLPAQTAAARRAGHELMLHVGMEPNDKAVDAGPNVLLTGAHAADIRQRLEWGLARFEGYVGVNNHMGSRFTRDEAGMEVVMAEMARRGLLFLDSRTSGRTVAAALAERHRVPFEERNIFLDSVDQPGEAEARLRELEAFARDHGRAIAIGHPKDRTLDALAAWLPTLKEKGLVLSPLSAAVAEREAVRQAAPRAASQPAQPATPN